MRSPVCLIDSSLMVNIHDLVFSVEYKFGYLRTANLPVSSKMMPEEERLLAWCYANLEDVQIVEIEEEALEIAMQELNVPIAGKTLLELLVNVFIRNAEVQRYGGGK